MRRTVARRAEGSRSDLMLTLFVRECRGETGAEDRGAQGRAFEVGLCLSGRCLCKFEDGTVLAHFCVNVAQKWRETSSNGPTNSASRVKSASQLNARAAVKVSNECSKDREERVALKRLERRAGGSQAA